MNIAMNNAMKKIGMAGASAFLATAAVLSVAHAASVNVVADTAVITQGASTKVNVVLDTQAANANAVQVQVTFSSDLFRLMKINDGTSAVSLWIRPPAESSPGVIDLAGIMPGGFSGSDAPLFSFVLQSIAQGTGTIQVATATVLANDGQGSSLPVTIGSMVVRVNAASANPAQPVLTPPSVETGAPDSFTPRIVSDPSIFDGKYFLVFSTTDTGSGIDHYEVLEVPSGASEQPFSSWHTAASPYLLTDQNLSSDIYVRAVDHDGNFIVVKVPAQHPYARPGYWGITAAAILALVLVVLLLVWMRRRRRHI